MAINSAPAPAPSSMMSSTKADRRAINQRASQQ
jgi:hypothetical protein